MYKRIEPIIENTVMQERYDENGKMINYVISAKEGYKLHAKSHDEMVLDKNGEETGKIKKGYTEGIVTVFAGYDFEKNEREIYAVEI